MGLHNTPLPRVIRETKPRDTSDSVGARTLSKENEALAWFPLPYCAGHGGMGVAVPNEPVIVPKRSCLRVGSTLLMEPNKLLDTNTPKRRGEQA